MGSPLFIASSDTQLEKTVIKMKLLCVLIFIHILSNGTLGCPEGIGWVPAGESCYLVSSGKMNWFEAQMFCGENNGYLAEIESADETAIINNLVPVEDGGIDVWIGLSDSANEGQWTWQHSYHPINYANWAPNQPLAGEWDCGAIALNAKFWYALGCDWTDESKGGPI